jgi:hypothetical protein
LAYFSDESIDEERPVYGIYKALEALTAALQAVVRGGRAKEFAAWVAR